MTSTGFNKKSIDEARKILDESHLLDGELGKYNHQRIANLSVIEQDRVTAILRWIQDQCPTLLTNKNAKSNFEKIFRYAAEHAASLVEGLVILKSENMLDDNAQELFNILFSSDNHARNAREVAKALKLCWEPENIVAQQLVISNPLHAKYYAKAFGTLDYSNESETPIALSLLQDAKGSQYSKLIIDHDMSEKCDFIFHILNYLKMNNLLEGKQGERNLQLFKNVINLSDDICEMLRNLDYYKILNQDNFNQLIRYAGKLDEMIPVFNFNSSYDDYFNHQANFDLVIENAKEVHHAELTYTRMASNVANKNSTIKDSIIPLTDIIAQFTGMPPVTLFGKPKQAAPSHSVSTAAKMQNGCEKS